MNLEHGQGVEEAALLCWNEQKFSNIKIPIEYSLIQTKDLLLEDGVIVKNREFHYNMKSLIIEGVDKFTEGEMFGLKYRDFKLVKDDKNIR